MVQVNFKNKIPPDLLAAGLYIDSTLKKAGFECYLVGGSVRDLLIGRTLADLDFTTNARPQQLLKLFPRTIPVGAEFGTVIVLHKKTAIEVTTYRLETLYEDGRRPKKIEFGDCLQEDLLRRDFTINGLACDFSEGVVIDHVNGLADLRNKIIRTIGDPMVRFSEDGLRPIRGCRFAASLGFTIEAATAAAMTACLPTVEKVAAERFYDEWRKTLKHSDRARFWQLIRDAGILPVFLRRLAAAVEQTSVWENLQQILKNSNPANMAMYAAYFLFSIKTFGGKKENIHDLGKDFFRECRFPVAEAKLALELVGSPFLGFTPEQKPTSVAVKKALAAVRIDHLRFHRRFAAEMLRHLYRENEVAVKQMEKEIAAYLRNIRRRREPLTIGDLAVNGNDLKEIGVTGTQIGEILRYLLDQVHACPDKNTKTELLALAAAQAKISI